MIGRGGDIVIACAGELLLGLCHEGGGVDGFAGAVDAGALAFGGIIEDQGDRSVLAHERHALALLNAEIRRIAQMIRMPVVAEEHENFHVLALHGLFQGAFARRQGVFAH